MKTIEVFLDNNGAYWIKFNRQNRYNAVNFEMYDELFPALRQAESDPNCKLIVITGNGKFYTSGSDQFNILDSSASKKQNIFRDFVDTLIDLKKPLVALVNGPAVGMGVSTLALCDVVIASDQANFYCPFTKLALVPEGCSSFTFPRIMGNSLATEMLLFNRKLTAQQMKEAGLVSRVISHDKFYEEAKELIGQYCTVNGEVLIRGKSLLRPKELIKHLHEVNHRETDMLKEAFISPQAVEAVMNFISRSKTKSKL